MGWKMTKDREAFDKKVSLAGLMPEPVALCGAALPKGTGSAVLGLQRIGDLVTPSLVR